MLTSSRHILAQQIMIRYLPAVAYCLRRFFSRYFVNGWQAVSELTIVIATCHHNLIDRG